MDNTRFKGSSNREVELRRGLLTVLLVLGAVALSFQGVKTGNIMFLLGVPMIPVVIYFVAHPSHLLVVSSWAAAASLYVPGLSNMLTLPEFMSVGIIAISLGTLAMGRQKEKSDSAAPYLFFMILLIIMLMAVRGSGFRIFGGATWGGKSYVRIMIPVLVYLMAGWLRLSNSLTKKLVYGAVIFGVLPVFVQMLINKTGAFGVLAQYFKVDAAIENGIQSDIRQADELVRVNGWSTLAGSILPLAFIFIPRKIGRITWMLGVAACSVLISAFSGFRGSTFSVMAVTFLYGIFCMREIRKKWITMAVTAGVCGYLTLLVFSSALPLTVQRTFSWVPGIQVASLASEAAGNSTDFRLEIWRMAAQDIGKYLIIGKGVAQNITAMAWLQSYYYATPEFFYNIHNYHSGPISVLMDFGLPGLILVVGFFVRVCIENFRSWRQIKPEGIMALYHRYLTVSFFWQVCVFFLIFGDMVDMFPAMIFKAALLMILRRSCIAEQKKTLIVA